jgi:Brp/Blh family beta-carotene 15,15'-monooxygenase
MELTNLLLPLALMTLLGVPHGALDGHVIKTMSQSTLGHVTFFALYTGIAMAGVASWLAFPTGAMISFLIISTVHFGRSDVAGARFSQPLLSVFARGGLWTIALPVIHWHTTSVFFDYLRADLDVIRFALILVLIPWALISAAHLFMELRNHNQRVCYEWLLALALIVVLPPLWALCLYFCGWHARRHMFRVFLSTKNSRDAIIDMLVFTAITFAIAAAVYFFYARHIELAPAAVVIFFVGIFALTLPHMVLIDTYLPHRHKHWRIDL